MTIKLRDSPFGGHGDVSLRNFLRRLETIEDFDAAWRLLCLWLRRTGFEECLYVRFPPVVVGLAQPLVRSTIDEERIRAYFDPGNQLYRPVLRQLSTDGRPVIWPDRRFHTFTREEFLQRLKMLDPLRSYRCIAVPVHGHGGSLSVIHCLTRRSKEELRDIFEIYRHRLHLMALHFDATVAQRRLANDIGLLTTRQRDCLLWVARGKTSWEVARILGISERTVNFHIQNCLRKLKATSRPEAIAKAMVAELIQP